MDNTKIDIVPKRNNRRADIWSKINPEKIDTHHKISPEAVKALIRMVELTGMTQAAIIEMAVVALLVGMTNNPYYEGLLDNNATMQNIKHRYPKSIDKFGFDKVRERALKGRTPIQRKWLRDFVEKDELYRKNGKVEEEDKEV
jgi:hypothetical protein